MAAKRRTRGFTLVEILIVVIILGILAAIVIPQFTNASDDARKSSLTSQLQTIRSQIQLYKLQHRENTPDLAQAGNEWLVFTGRTDEDGTINASTGAFGPYLQQIPNNPLTNTATFGADGTAGVGWVYDKTTGNIHALNKDGTVFVE